MSAEAIAHTASEVRDNLVTTAVSFLKNPNVNRCTMESKERFLRAKGLTDIEIQRAVEKCGEFLDVPSVTSELMFFQHSRRSWFRDHIVPLLVYGGFAYGCYWIYKNCIRHLLFVEEPKRKTTAECIDEVRKSLDILNASVTSLRGDMQASAQSSLRTQLDGLKSDLASVKGILLNRNQFPSLKTRTDPPSIPAWQRQSEEATSTEVAVEDKKPHRSRSQRSESGGSNSSEGEQATKNSDSSLEIIASPSEVQHSLTVKNNDCSDKIMRRVTVIPTEEETSRKLKQSESEGSNSSEGKLVATKDSGSSLEIIT